MFSHGYYHSGLPLRYDNPSHRWLCWPAYPLDIGVQCFWHVSIDLCRVQNPTCFGQGVSVPLSRQGSSWVWSQCLVLRLSAKLVYQGKKNESFSEPFLHFVLSRLTGGQIMTLQIIIIEYFMIFFISNSVLKIYFFYFLSVSVCLHVCARTICVQCPWEPEESLRSPGTEVTDGCEPLCRCWESNLVLYKSSQCSLTVEPSF